MGALIRVLRVSKAIAAGGLAMAIVGLSASPAFADQIRDREWYLSVLEIPKSHAVTRGSGVRVAVVDSGVWPDHPDLSGAILPGRKDLAGDGRIDDDGHGTGMAGIIAGRGHGSTDGVMGIAPEAQVVPVAIPTGEGMGRSVAIADAVVWAAQNGAKVINLSLRTSDSRALHDAVKQAADSDAVVVAAAGNKGEKDPGAIYPGNYPEALTVGAVDQNGSLAQFSLSGAQVDLVAPGVAVVMTGTKDKDRYLVGDGTSQSAAIVSGAVALVRAKFPEMSAAEVVHRLTATAVDKGPPGRDDQYGYGELNIVGALTADVPPLATASPPVGGAQPGDASPPVKGGSAIKPVVWVVGGGVVLLILAVAFLVVYLRRGDRSAA